MSCCQSGPQLLLALGVAEVLLQRPGSTQCIGQRIERRVGLQHLSPVGDLGFRRKENAGGNVCAMRITAPATGQPDDSKWSTSSPTRCITAASQGADVSVWELGGHWRSALGGLGR